MKFSFVSILILLLSGIVLFSQSEKVLQPSVNIYRVAFWNIENYFDSFTDSTSTYNEFNYEGDRHWSYSKYQNKRTGIYKTILAMGEWQSLAMIGLAEIENEFVLRDLLANTPLKSKGYRIIHYDSEDFRGIDVGLIYQPEQFDVLFSKKIVVRDAVNPDFRTRDLLYVKGFMGSDTVHVFVNHWPSRYRGYLNSEPLRILASEVLKHSTDSICAIDSDAAIVVMGDFNDRPENESVYRLTSSAQACGLFYLPLFCSNKNVKGTIKYQGKWDYFDHILLSKSLSQENGLYVANNGTGTIFAPDFLLEKDDKFIGMRPRRAFIGYKYNGGISDHLPVYVDFVHKN